MKEYDYWDYKNGPMYSLYYEKFEKQVQVLELKISQAILGIDESICKYSLFRD
jgi:hypothetical protein